MSDPTILPSSTPRPSTSIQQPEIEPDSISEPFSLTPLRAHYLKRELVTLQFASELESLSNPSALSLLGPPFLPANQFINGHPIYPPLDSKLTNFNRSNQPFLPSDTQLPFLRFFFHKFVLSFPFLLNLPDSFFTHKVQPFVYSFFSRNFSRSDDREEETKRQKIAGKVEKHLALIMAAAIKVNDNKGQEQVVRVTPGSDPTPNDDDAFVSTPIIAPVPDQTLLDPNQITHQVPSIVTPTSFDLNVVAIRRVRVKSRMRSKVHEEFLIRTRTQSIGETYVSRRYRDFFKLAESLRVEFPDADIKPPPPKDRSAIDTTSDDAPLENNMSPLLNGTTEDTQPRAKIHFSRENNRLTLRAYLHRLLAKPEISNSLQFYKFLTDEPIELSFEEQKDVENREAMDRARENEKNKFRSEVEARVKELEDYLRGFREELVKRDGLSRVFSTIREVDSVSKLPVEYRKVIEWARISLASTIYQVFLGSDNASASFSQLKRMHALLPYWAMRGVLKISNPVAMIRGVLDLFLARPFGATSLIQRMFSSGLHEEISELKEDAEKVAGKIGDERLCERIKTFVEAPREIQEIYESDAKQEKLDIIAVILRSPEGPKLDKAAYQRIHRASQAFEIYKTYRDGLQDPTLNEGPDNEDAWLFEDLHVYMKLLRKCRDKEQLVELIFEGTTSELLKDIITIFYSPLMQVYKAANISESLLDLQKFIDDLIRTVERADEYAVRDAQKVVQTFIDLVARHEGAFYNFVHQVHSKGAGLFDGLMHWIELLVNFVREGLRDRISLEALLPHSDTTERLKLMEEIDSIIEYHRKLKLAHHERMLRRMARNDRVVQEDQYEREKDSAFVTGVIKNLNLGDGVVKDVEEAANEESDDSDQEDVLNMSNCSSNPIRSLSHSRTPSEENRKNEYLNNKGSKDIIPPDLVIVPTLTPLFTELVKNLLR